MIYLPEDTSGSASANSLDFDTRPRNTTHRSILLRHLLLLGA